MMYKDLKAKILEMQESVGLPDLVRLDSASVIVDSDKFVSSHIELLDYMFDIAVRDGVKGMLVDTYLDRLKKFYSEALKTKETK